MKLYTVLKMMNTEFCDICDELCIERYYKNHLKSQTHTNNKHKRKSFQINLLN